jgi:hypothetical protein
MGASLFSAAAGGLGMPFAGGRPGRGFSLLGLSTIQRKTSEKKPAVTDIGWCFWERGAAAFCPEPQESTAAFIRASSHFHFLMVRSSRIR